MKKLLFLLICLCVVLSGCGNPDLWTDSYKDKIPKTTYATDDNGNTTMTEKSGDTTIADNLPCAIKYNGKNVYLKSVDFYEHYDDGGTYSYFLYCVVTFDVSELDNADVHWLQKEDADVYALYNEPEKENDTNFKHIGKLGSLFVEESGELLYAFAPSNFSAYRNSFGGKGYAVSMDLKQEETYETPKSSELRKVNRITYFGDIPESMPDSEEIPQPIYGYMTKWVKEQADFFGSMAK